jgi:glutathione S-transferase
MKLYLTPGACSLADHIAMCEAGLEFDRIRVDLRSKRTESGEDFNAINPKGYVPALVLDDGQLLTENVAILCWVAERAPELAPSGQLGRIRLIEMLAFIATELHKPFVRAFFPTSDAEKEAAREIIDTRFGFVADRLRGD